MSQQSAGDRERSRVATGIGRAVSTPARRWLLALTLLLGVAATVLMTAAAPLLAYASARDLHPRRP